MPMKSHPGLLKFLRRLLLSLAAVGTLLAAFVVEENWRGDRAWAATERALRAQGEPLDLAAFATPPIPDDRNFFKAPLLDGLLSAKEPDPKIKRLRDATTLDVFSHVMSRSMFDVDHPERRQTNGAKSAPTPKTASDPTGFLHLAQGYLLQEKVITTPLSDDPATDILAALKPVQPLLDAIRDAARERQDAWIPVTAPQNFGLTFQASLALDLGSVLSGRSRAELALGHTDDAFADAVGLLGMARATRAGAPGLLNTLVGNALRVMGESVLKEGSRQHQWTDVQLSNIGRQLAEFQLFVQLRKSFQVERVWVLHNLDSTMVLDPKLRPRVKAGRWLYGLIHGWAQQDKIGHWQFVQGYLNAFDSASGQMFPARVSALQKNEEAKVGTRSYYEWVTGEKYAGKIVSMLTGSGESENSHREALIACALERYYLAHGNYPTTLAELAPAFIATLPTDVFSGQPLGYSRSSDGGFKLTSLAADGHSEGKTWVQPGSP